MENIGTYVKSTWNYFPCLVLHKVKVFIDYAQGLVQLLFLIFTSLISFLHCLWKDGKAVNYNGSEIIGLIHLKYGKRTACRDNFFYCECGIFPEKQGKGQQRGRNLNLSDANVHEVIGNDCGRLFQTLIRVYNMCQSP